MYRLLLVSAMDDQPENDPSGEDDTEAGALMPEEEQTSTQDNGDAFVSLSQLTGGVPAADEVSQAEVLDHIYKHQLREGNKKSDEAMWENTNQTHVRLSELRKAYKARETGQMGEQQKDRLIHGLRSRTRLVVDNEYIIPNNDRLLGWPVKGHKIDYEMRIPDGSHWGVIYSEDNLNSVPYNVELHLKKLNSRFRAKHARLPFIREGRMVLTGRFQDEDLWCAFVPCHYETEETLEQLEDTGGDSRLRPERAKVWQLFMSYVLTRLRIDGVYVDWKAFKHEDIRTLSVKDYTNAL